MQRGFTLIELIIYVAILSLVAVNLSMFALSVSDSGGKTSVGSEVQDTVRSAMGVMAEQIQKAESVRVASSTFDADPGILVLEMGDSAVNPTVISLTADDGTLELTQGDSSPMVTSITSSEVAVTNLVFTNLTASSSRDHIKIEMTVEYKDPGSQAYEYTQSIETAVSTRN